MDEVRYYKVLQDTFLWEKDAIISNEDDEDAFVAVSSVFNKFPHDEYISAGIVEHIANKDFFERVYRFEDANTEDDVEVPATYKSVLDTKQWHHASYKQSK